MTKPMKMTPGTYLEVDDLNGGRKVALVCKDGVSFLDSLDVEKATPVVIHPIFNPVELGSMMAFAKARGLQDALRALVKYLRQQMDPSVDDPLMVMRALWLIAGKEEVIPPGYVPDEVVLRWACNAARQQADAALRLHGYAEQFHAVA
ncbi:MULTISPECIES: hypothetical protein [Xanthomonas]|uniref:Uncharacterized protein n=5 Tax=Xanthomonas TaxID=338 RepID=A0A7Z7NH27_XANCH|nr:MULTISPECIES: hypothetical protein [Xanthomonas]MDO6948412.1 hypothetical protein [Xanthomonas vasicola]MDO6960413.1 hypothetical protein [Xanthomonas vasicola]WOP59105.1 hypothetical protein R5577_22890 [Xanthomonas euvesicatoria]SOO23685.1 conserved hypothetical protein [Xanthomonas phaseoli pv. phaseoli]